MGALAATKFGKLLWPEGFVGMVVGVGGGIALLGSLTVGERVNLVGDTLAALGVLLGVVFAAFAVLIAFLSDSYLRLLNKAAGGIIVFLRPFMIAVGCQTTALLLAIAYRAAATDLESRVEVGLFLAWAFLFVFSVADVVALARNLSMHGVTRAEHVASGDGSPTVTNLRDRQGG